MNHLACWLLRASSTVVVSTVGYSGTISSGRTSTNGQMFCPETSKTIIKRKSGSISVGFAHKITDKKLHNKIYQFVVSDLGLITRNAANKNESKTTKRDKTKNKTRKYRLNLCVDYFLK